jgi:hypothetical protein
LLNRGSNASRCQDRCHQLASSPQMHLARSDLQVAHIACGVPPSGRITTVSGQKGELQGLAAVGRSQSLASSRAAVHESPSGCRHGLFPNDACERIGCAQLMRLHGSSTTTVNPNGRSQDSDMNRNQDQRSHPHREHCRSGRLRRRPRTLSRSRAGPQNSSGAGPTDAAIRLGHCKGKGAPPRLPASMSGSRRGGHPSDD